MLMAVKARLRGYFCQQCDIHSDCCFQKEKFAITTLLKDRISLLKHEENRGRYILAKIKGAFRKVSEREIKEGVLTFSFTQHQEINHLYSRK